MKVSHQFRLCRIIAAAICALGHVGLIAQEVQPLPNNSAFRNVGYRWQDAETPVVPHATEMPSEAPSVEAPTHVPVVEATPILTETSAAPCATCQPSCTCVKCDEKKKAELKTAASSAHKEMFYANNFSYLNDPCYDGCLLGDGLKQFGEDPFSFEFGGQYRARFHREENFRGLGITGNSDDFLLHRTRLYLNTQVGDNVRFYAETLDAVSNYETFAPRAIEENRWDMQNLFLDLTLLDGDSGKLVARGGRQEIALGAQRYVSPLDWANTRRTFDGGRLMYSNENWDVDGFWLAPLVHDVKGFDKADENSAFYGVYSTYKQLENGTLDLYWLAFDSDTIGFDFDSLGARYNGKLGNYLFEAEGAYQFGTNADGSDHDASFYTIGLGKAFADRSCKPTTWLYFDWASGADQQGAGNGHHHFQPLAHKYNGFMDIYGRRNLIDLNWLTTMQLAPKVKLLTWYHSFWLENSNDTPYSVVMTPFAPGVTPGDSHLGHEIDAVLSLGINERSDILFGYSHFWAGDYYDTPGLPANTDADFFYTQYTLNF